LTIAFNQRLYAYIQDSTEEKKKKSFVCVYIAMYLFSYGFLLHYLIDGWI